MDEAGVRIGWYGYAWLHDTYVSFARESDGRRGKEVNESEVKRRRGREGVKNGVRRVGEDGCEGQMDKKKEGRLMVCACADEGVVCVRKAVQSVGCGKEKERKKRREEKREKEKKQNKK